MKIYKSIDASEEEFVIRYKGILIVVTSSSAHAYSTAGALNVEELKEAIEKFNGDIDLINFKNIKNSIENKNINLIPLGTGIASRIYNHIKSIESKATEATECQGPGIPK